MIGTANWYFGARPDGLATLFTVLSFYLLAPDDRSKPAAVDRPVVAHERDPRRARRFALSIEEDLHARNRNSRVPAGREERCP
jgi:hypothetical protein